MLHQRGLCDSAVVALLWLVAAVTPVAARPEPSYVLWEGKWEELKTRSGTNPACIVDHDIEHEAFTAIYSAPMTVTRAAVTMAVFDMERAGTVLDRVFLVPPETKVKEAWAWSHELGASGVTWATEKEVHVVRIRAGWQEVRISVPGLSKAGMCGVGIEAKAAGIPFISQDFVSDLPLLRGEVRMVFPRARMGAVASIEEYLDTDCTTIVRGPVEEVPPEFTDRGYMRSYRVRDLPARPAEPLVLAEDLVRAEIQMVPNWVKWKHWFSYYDDKLKEATLSKASVKAARDTLEAASPIDVVRAVARRLDDPSHFRLRGSPRSAAFNVGDPAKIAKTMEGDGFDKALLAYCLLKSLKVESHLVFAASRYKTILDGRVADPRRLDAVLLWIPAVSDEFLWDIANRSIPLGEAGSDLYTEMIVCDPEADSYGRQFSLSSAGLNEERSAEMALDQDGVLAGPATFRFAGWPMVSDIDPWDRDQDVTAAIQEVLPKGAKADSASWVEVNWNSARCSTEKPAVLCCRVSFEAAPRGEKGWEIKPFFGSLPGPLADLRPADRKLPVFLQRRIEVTERATIRLGGRRATRTPAPIRIDNQAGLFECAWEPTDGGVIARRRLRVVAQHAAGDRLRDLLALCTAWEEAKGSAMEVE